MKTFFTKKHLDSKNFIDPSNFSIWVNDTVYDSNGKTSPWDEVHK